MPEFDIHVYMKKETCENLGSLEETVLVLTFIIVEVSD